MFASKTTLIFRKECRIIFLLDGSWREPRAKYERDPRVVVMGQ
jgi:hypothetical protein